MEWNEETIASIRRLWAEGLSTAEIGRRMGISKNAVVGKAHRLNLSPRPSPIRRTPAGAAPARQAPRRAAITTLPALRVPDAAHTLSAIAPLRPQREAVRPDPSPQAAPRPAPHPAPVLRSVPTQPRPTGRVSACCWPLGDPGTPTFRFCSGPAIPGKPYCTEHAALAYVKVRDRREDAA